MNEEPRAQGGLRFEYMATHRVLVSYQWGPSIGDEDWDAYVGCVHEHRQLQREIRTCVFSQGSTPTREQLQRLRAVSEGFVTKVAMITPQPPPGFTMAVLTLHNKNLRSFLPDDRLAAYAYLELTPEQMTAVDAAYERLKTQSAQST